MQYFQRLWALPNVHNEEVSQQIWCACESLFHAIKFNCYSYDISVEWSVGVRIHTGPIIIS